MDSDDNLPGNNFHDESSREAQDEGHEDPQEPKTSKVKKIRPEKNRKEKRGIIYFSSIPEGLCLSCFNFSTNSILISVIVSDTGMNPTNARRLLSRHGELDRIYFVPLKTRKGVPYLFKEGWVEFKKKVIAKAVVPKLNGQEIDCKRNSPLSGCIWNMKYIHRLKWHHLTEQTNYTKMARDQRMQLEMGRVTKESNFFAEQMDELKKRKKNRTVETDSRTLKKRKDFYDQRQRKQWEQQQPGESPGESSNPGIDTNLLSRIFS